MGLGASSVLPVRVNDPLLTFGRLWSGAQAAMQPAPGLSFEGRLLAEGTPAGFCEAALARPIATKTRCPAGFDQRFVVNYFHRFSSPLIGSGVHQFKPVPARGL